MIITTERKHSFTKNLVYILIFYLCQNTTSDLNYFFFFPTVLTSCFVLQNDFSSINLFGKITPSFQFVSFSNYLFPTFSSYSDFYVDSKNKRQCRLNKSRIFSLVPFNNSASMISSKLTLKSPLLQETKFDVFSRLFRDRIIWIGTQITEEVSNLVVAQLLYLANEDEEKDIQIFINSPGGSVYAGLAIFDAMQYVKCDVSTISFGTAASMAAFLLSAGTKGKRKSLPNARIMIHQPIGGAEGHASDIEIQAKEILFTRSRLNAYMAHFTNQTTEKIEEDCDRDFFMTPIEAKQYGIIDEVVNTKLSNISLHTPVITLD